MIPTQTLVQYPVFGNAACIVKPDDAKYAAGFLPADVLPAEWHNYFLNTASSAITCLNAGVSSMEAELNCVVTSAGLQPAEGTAGQVAQAISCCVTNAVTRSIQITDSSKTNCGSAVNFTSSTALQIALPSTICATLQGNAATATLATCAQKDGSGCSLGTAARYACGCFAAAYCGSTSCVCRAGFANKITDPNGAYGPFTITYSGNISDKVNWILGWDCSDTTKIAPVNMYCMCVKYATSAGSATSATSATNAARLADVANATAYVYLGYAGASLTCSQITHIAGYSVSCYCTGKTIVKDINDEAVIAWLKSKGLDSVSCSDYSCISKAVATTSDAGTRFRFNISWDGTAGYYNLDVRDTQSASIWCTQTYYSKYSGTATTAGFATCASKDASGCNLGTAARCASGDFATAFCGCAKCVQCAAVAESATCATKAFCLRWEALVWGTHICGNQGTPTAMKDLLIFPRTKGAVCFYKTGQTIPVNCTCLLNCYYYSQTY